MVLEVLRAFEPNRLINGGELSDFMEPRFTRVKAGEYSDAALLVMLGEMGVLTPPVLAPASALASTMVAAAA